MQLMDGKKLSKQLSISLRQKFQSLQLPQIPTVVILQIGDSPASNRFIQLKVKKGESLGIKVIHKKYPAGITQAKLLKHIKVFNQDLNVSGLMLQLPLPSHLDVNFLLDSISVNKDIDGLNSENNRVYPAVVEAVLRLIDTYKIELEKKQVLILNNTRLIGQPLGKALISKHAIVTIADKYTKNITNLAKNSDILVSATGVANLVSGSWIKSGAVVIDIGFPGDVDFISTASKTSFITPVPGGVGPMTVYSLFENLFKLISLSS